MKKKLLLTLACLCSIVMGAKADGYGLSVCGIEVTDANKGDLIAIVNSQKDETDPVSTGTMTFDSETKTLIMKDVSIEINNVYIIQNTQNLTVEQTGTNTIKASSWILMPNAADLTIQGNGTLTLICTTGWAYNNQPIYVNRNLNGECTITIDHTTLETKGELCGSILGSSDATLVINESTVKAVGGIDYWKEIILTNASISEPTGAFVKSNWAGIVNEKGETAANVVIVPDTRKDAGLSWDTELFHIEYGNDFTNPTLINANGLAVTYESNHPEFATVDATGKITIVKPSIVDYYTGMSDDGEDIETVHIKAVFAGNTEYKPQIAGIHFEVLKGRLHFEVTGSTTAVLDESFQSPVVKLLNGRNEEVNVSIAFSSSNESVATVDATTGVVTPIGVGETVISYSFAGNEYYVGMEDFYYLMITASTGIHSVNETGEDCQVVYDLLGRRVKNVTKGGIYVVGGHKVMK